MEQMRAVRPFYLMIDQVLNDPTTRENLVERDRALALEAVLNHAPDSQTEAFRPVNATILDGSKNFDIVPSSL